MYKIYVYDKTFKHGQMAAILFMQIRWSLFIYELFEPLAALEMFAFFTDDVFMYNQSTLLITSLLSQSHKKNNPKIISNLQPKANLHIN